YRQDWWSRRRVRTRRCVWAARDEGRGASKQQILPLRLTVLADFVLIGRASRIRQNAGSPTRILATFEGVWWGLNPSTSAPNRYLSCSSRLSCANFLRS